MGGYGSGWHGGDGRPYRRMRVSECRVVLTADQIRRKAIEDNVPLSQLATAQIRVPLDAAPAPPWTLAAIVTSHPIYRQGRVFLRCPCCGHQVGRLYQPREGWPLSCRRCHRLTYRSTQESRKMPAGLVKELRYLIGW